MKKEDIFKFYQTYRFYIFPAVVALSSLFLIFFAIYPQITILISSQKTAEDLTIKAKFLESKVAALESLDEDNLSQKVGLALESLPDNKDFGGTLGLLQQLVIKSGFSISSISLSTDSHKLGQAEGFEVKLEIKGARDMFLSLIDNLENSPRLIRINNFDISANAGQQIIDASLGVEVLYARFPQSLGTTDAPLLELSQKDNEVLSTLAASNIKDLGSFENVLVSSRGKSNPFE